MLRDSPELLYFQTEKMKKKICIERKRKEGGKEGKKERRKKGKKERRKERRKEERKEKKIPKMYSQC